MREIRSSGSVRGGRRNPYPYRDSEGLILTFIEKRLLLAVFKAVIQSNASYNWAPDSVILPVFPQLAGISTDFQPGCGDLPATKIVVLWLNLRISICIPNTPSSMGLAT